MGSTVLVPLDIADFEGRYGGGGSFFHVPKTGATFVLPSHCILISSAPQ